MIDELARRAGADFDSAPAEALMTKWRERDALLAKPLTFMNASGEAVGPLMRYFKLTPDDVLVVSKLWQEQLRQDYGVEAGIVTNGVRGDRFGAGITPRRRQELRQ